MPQQTRTCAACGGGLQSVGTLVAYAGKMWCATCRPELHPHPVEEPTLQAGEPDDETPSLDN